MFALHPTRNWVDIVEGNSSKFIKVKKATKKAKLIFIYPFYSLVFLMMFGLILEAQAASERISPSLQDIIQQSSGNADTGAEVLLRKKQLELDENFLESRTEYMALRVADDEAARDYNQIRLYYDSYYSELSLDFANVLLPSGEMLPLSKDAIQIQTPGQTDFYQDRKALVFSLPSLKPGSVIEFQFQQRSIKPLVKNQWYEAEGFYWWQPKANNSVRLDPINQYEFQVITPTNVDIFYKLPERLKGFSKRSSAAKNTYKLSLKDLPKIEVEGSMPESVFVEQMFFIGTSNSWLPIASWARNLVETKVDPGEGVKSLAKKLVPAQATHIEKIQAVYDYMQNNVRYVFAHVGRGGYTPHPIEEVLTNQYGDCKDQSVLAIGLLRELGITAHAALISTKQGKFIDADLPSVGFNHMIVYIPPQNGEPETWFDSSGDKAIFPGYSFGLEDSPALILNNDKQPKIVYTPRLPMEQHGADLVLSMMESTTDKVTVDFEIRLRGSYEQYYRSWWAYNPDRQKALRDLAPIIFTNAEFVDAVVHNADSLRKPMWISGTLELKVKNHSESGPTPLAVGLNQILRMFEGLNEYEPPSLRDQDLEIRNGHVIRLIADINVPDDNYSAFTSSAGPSLDSEYFTLKQSSQPTDSGMRVTIEFSYPNQLITKEEYGHFYNELFSLEDLAPWVVSFTKDKQFSLPADKNIAGVDDSIQSRINGVQSLLDKGEFKKALAQAESLVSEFPKNAQAYYFLGLAQGYSGMFDQSNESFEKAMDLGHEL